MTTTITPPPPPPKMTLVRFTREQYSVLLLLVSESKALYCPSFVTYNKDITYYPFLASVISLTFNQRALTSAPEEMQLMEICE